MLLGFNIVVVLLVTIYKFTDRQIAPLYVLQTLSHYSFYLTFFVLVYFSDNPKLELAGCKILRKTWLLHIIYPFLMYFGYVEASKCSSDLPYPVSFVFGGIIFFISYSALLKFKYEVSSCWTKHGLTELER